MEQTWRVRLEDGCVREVVVQWKGQGSGARYLSMGKEEAVRNEMRCDGNMFIAL